MSDGRPTRRALMRPVQLLGFAFGAAVFAGVVTLMTMGLFQRNRDPRIQAEIAQSAVTAALVVAGLAFILTLVIIALLMLVVDPAQVTKQIDRPVLLPDEPGDPADPPPGAPPAADDGPRP